MNSKEKALDFRLRKLAQEFDVTIGASFSCDLRTSINAVSNKFTPPKVGLDINYVQYRPIK